MQTYQEALQLAVEQKYDLSLNKLEETLKILRNEVSKDTPYQLFVLERVASL